jgi:hypothetical protein
LLCLLLPVLLLCACLPPHLPTYRRILMLAAGWLSAIAASPVTTASLAAMPPAVRPKMPHPSPPPRPPPAAAAAIVSAAAACHQLLQPLGPDKPPTTAAAYLTVGLHLGPLPPLLPALYLPRMVQQAY